MDRETAAEQQPEEAPAVVSAAPAKRARRATPKKAAAMAEQEAEAPTRRSTRRTAKPDQAHQAPEPEAPKQRRTRGAAQRDTKGSVDEMPDLAAGQPDEQEGGTAPADAAAAAEGDEAHAPSEAPDQATVSPRGAMPAQPRRGRTKGGRSNAKAASESGTPAAAAAPQAPVLAPRTTRRMAATAAR